MHFSYFYDSWAWREKQTVSKCNGWLFILESIRYRDARNENYYIVAEVTAFNALRNSNEVCTRLSMVVLFNSTHTFFRTLETRHSKKVSVNVSEWEWTETRVRTSIQDDCMYRAKIPLDSVAHWHIYRGQNGEHSQCKTMDVTTGAIHFHRNYFHRFGSIVVVVAVASFLSISH